MREVGGGSFAAFGRDAGVNTGVPSPASLPAVWERQPDGVGAKDRRPRRSAGTAWIAYLRPGLVAQALE